jgi:hypothetical protein
LQDDDQHHATRGKDRLMARARCLALILLFAFAASTADAAPGAAHVTIGVNKFDLLMQYLGTASGGDGGIAYREITQAMARKAMADAHSAGVRYLRVAVSGFRPLEFGSGGDLQRWIQEPEEHWRLVDRMMDDLHRNDLQLIATFGWNLRQFPAIAGEKTSDMTGNPGSKSYALLVKYVTEFVTRYRDHPALLFYELGNEYNLRADLDIVARCLAERHRDGFCDPLGNFSTADLIAFTQRLTAHIRTLDRSHAVSSGFSLPRPAASELQRKPEWQTRRWPRKLDSVEELEAVLRQTHEHVDIISVHLYPSEGHRFGSRDPVALLDVVQRIALGIGKPLFVGEFGQADSPSLGESSYTERMMDRLLALGVPYSAVWVWQLYQDSLYRPYGTRPSSYSLEQGYTDRIIDKLRNANRARPIAASDRAPPNVVLTWPLPCSRARTDKQLLFAIASDDSGRLGRVELWVDDTRIAELARPPYSALLDPLSLSIGEHLLRAKAYDPSGNVSEFATPWLIGAAPAPGSRCASSMLR